VDIEVTVDDGLQQEVFDQSGLDVVMECLHHRASPDIRRGALRLVAVLVAHIGENVIGDERLVSGLGIGLQDEQPANQVAACSLLVEVLLHSKLDASVPLPPPPRPDEDDDSAPSRLEDSPPQPLYKVLIGSLVSSSKIGGLAMLPALMATGRLAWSPENAEMLLQEFKPGLGNNPMLSLIMRCLSRTDSDSTTHTAVANAAAAAWALGQLGKHNSDCAKILTDAEVLEALIDQTVNGHCHDQKKQARDALEITALRVDNAEVLGKVIIHKAPVGHHGFMGLEDTQGAGFTIASPDVLIGLVKIILAKLTEDLVKHGSEQLFVSVAQIEPIKDEEKGERYTDEEQELKNLVQEIQKLKVRKFVGFTSFAGNRASLGGTDKTTKPPTLAK
jgi:hypothetical protein